MLYTVAPCGRGRDHTRGKKYNSQAKEDGRERSGEAGWKGDRMEAEREGKVR